MAWTTSELLTQIRRHAYLSDNHPTYTSTVLLGMADEVLAQSILPAVHALRQEWAVAVQDYTVTAGTADHRLPARALFGAVRSVVLLDSSGAVVGPLGPLTYDEALAYSGTTTAGPGGYAGFVVVDEAVRLVPTPATTSGTLRVSYLRRPGALTAPSTAADESPHAITINPTSATVTLGTHGFDQGDLVDFVQANPPFATLAQGVELLNAVGDTIIMASGVTGAAVGDYVCTTGTAPVPQIPPELHPVLARGVAVQVLEESGGQDRYQMGLERYERALRAVLGLMSPRQRGEPERLGNAYSRLGRGSVLRPPARG